MCGRVLVIQINWESILSGKSIAWIIEKYVERSSKLIHRVPDLYISLTCLSKQAA